MKQAMGKELSFDYVNIMSIWPNARSAPAANDVAIRLWMIELATDTYRAFVSGLKGKKS
jgi:hypothetical protein